MKWECNTQSNRRHVRRRGDLLHPGQHMGRRRPRDSAEDQVRKMERDAHIQGPSKRARTPTSRTPGPRSCPAQPPAAFGTGDPDPRLFGAGPKPVTVEEVPDVDMRRDSAGVSLPQSPASSSHPPSAPRRRWPPRPRLRQRAAKVRRPELHASPGAVAHVSSAHTTLPAISLLRQRRTGRQHPPRRQTSRPLLLLPTPLLPRKLMTARRPAALLQALQPLP